MTEIADAGEHGSIPKTQFLDDVDLFMKQQTDDVESILKRFQELHHKYSFFESNLVEKKRRFLSQIPDIEMNLEVLSSLDQRRSDNAKSVQTHFLLNDHLLGKADVPLSGKICLWLGANVMVEYTEEEAGQLLSKNLESARASVATIESDLTFLRDQTTTLEVNMARLYNWNVEQQRTKKPRV